VLLDEEQYRALQLALALRPERGVMSSGAAGPFRLGCGITLIQSVDPPYARPKRPVVWEGEAVSPISIPMSTEITANPARHGILGA
jgi:hypothetical protein